MKAEISVVILCHKAFSKNTSNHSTVSIEMKNGKGIFSKSNLLNDKWNAPLLSRFDPISQTYFQREKKSIWKSSQSCDGKK